MSIRTIEDVLTEEDMMLVLEVARLVLDDPKVVTDFELVFSLPDEHLKGLNSRVNYILDNKLPMNE